MTAVRRRIFGRVWIVHCRAVAWDGRTDKFCAVRVANEILGPQINSEAEAICVVQENRMAKMHAKLPDRAFVDWTAKEET